jgi:CRP/FNR family putative post-exponential-phase nitrogen-starvation transcriptional regulator
LKNIFLLLRGKLQVDSLQQDGKQVVFSFETPLSIIGDMEILNDMSVLSNVKAIEDSWVFAAPIEIIRRCGLNDPPFLRFLVRYLIKKLYFSSSLLAQSTETAEFRLARYLLYRSQFEGNTLRLETRESIAAILGVSVRHLNRTLKELAAQNAIHIHNKTLSILNPQILQELLERGI